MTLHAALQGSGEDAIFIGAGGSLAVVHDHETALLRLVYAGR